MTHSRVVHSGIYLYLAVGGRVYNQAEEERENRFQQELSEAIASAQAKANREKQQALFTLRKLLGDERAKALKKQKEHYEEVARRVAEQRDK